MRSGLSYQGKIEITLSDLELLIFKTFADFGSYSLFTNNCQDACIKVLERMDIARKNLTDKQNILIVGVGALVYSLQRSSKKEAKRKRK